MSDPLLFEVPLPPTREDSPDRESNQRTALLERPRTDVILRSSDGSFRVSQHILSIASPIIPDVLSLPAPADNDSPSEKYEALPVVLLAEDAATLDLLLKWALIKILLFLHSDRPWAARTRHLLNLLPTVDVEHRAVPPQGYAAYPFDRNATSTDIALRSSDDVLFRVAKHVLSTASPVFTDMLSLGPSPAYAATQVQADATFTDNTCDELPVFRVVEDAATLDVLLRPPLTELENLQRLIVATQHYDIHAFDDAIKEALDAQLARDPLTVLGIAVTNHLGDCARRAILALPISTLISLELPAVTDHMLVAFIRYHTACGFAAAAVTTQRDIFRHTLGFTVKSASYGVCKQCPCEDPSALHGSAKCHPHKNALLSCCKGAKCGTCDYSLEQEIGLKKFMKRLGSAVDAAIEQVPVPDFW
ncbi:hypothetical protein FA95DRAFT_1573209 [Auriscalpium vulgare]|uniref:Uncharacterized protein n=1 Tax=Auriscalpium vulgare TaxID=40419 RepID=A0ACB8RQL0_9AGAM|nr:hypothetical protein FA95DRAFT_1573209 [Auriscalpium vulgare]